MIKVKERERESVCERERERDTVKMRQNVIEKKGWKEIEREK